jgi:hypothetical protein
VNAVVETLELLLRKTKVFIAEIDCEMTENRRFFAGFCGFYWEVNCKAITAYAIKSGLFLLELRPLQRAFYPAGLGLVAATHA